MRSVIGIFVIGPSSTGKTTLCKALEDEMRRMGIKFIHISEVARTVMRNLGFTRDNVGELAMQREILIAQVEEERTALLSFAKDWPKKGHADELGEPMVLLCDRSAIDPLVYTQRMLGLDCVEELKNSEEFKEALARYAGLDDDPERTQYISLKPTIILTNAVKEWIVDDGVRSLEDPWKIGGIFRDLLDGLGLAYSELGEEVMGIDERVEWVLKLSNLGEPTKRQPNKIVYGTGMSPQRGVKHFLNRIYS